MNLETTDIEESKHQNEESSAQKWGLIATTVSIATIFGLLVARKKCHNQDEDF